MEIIIEIEINRSLAEPELEQIGARKDTIELHLEQMSSD